MKANKVFHVITIIIVSMCFLAINTVFAGDHDHEKDHKGHKHHEMKSAKDTKAKTIIKKDYPLDTCPVSGGKLGSMGEPVIFTYKGQEIKACCQGCIPVIKKNPEKYLKIIQDAFKKNDG